MSITCTGISPDELLIGDHTPEHVTHDVTVDDEVKARGLVPRDYGRYPVGCYASAPGFQAVDMPLIPQGEWSERIRDKVATRSQLSDIRLSSGPNGGLIPSLDQDSVGYCLPPGSLIRMADGSQKPIETIRLHEEVVSGEGNVRRVMQLHSREYDGDMITVKAWGHGHLRLTSNHKVMTRRGYVQAGKLTADDWVAAPRYTARPLAVVQTALHMVRNGVLLRAGKDHWKGREEQPVPDFIKLTRGVGRILGMWLAEGSLDEDKGARVTWSFGTEKKMHLVEELITLLKEEWGVDARAVPGPVESVTNVRLAGRTWARLFESLMGRRAEGKRLHPDLTNGPAEFLEGLFQGWMDCDGCRRKTEKRAEYRIGCTVSHTLAMNMYDIANAMGLCPTINREEAQVNSAAASRQQPWKIKVIPEPKTYRPNYRMQVDGDRVWRKVYGLEHEHYKGLVYNIGVEKDNSYTCESLWVRNCWAHSTTGCVMMLRAVMGEPYVALSAFAVASIIKQYKDEGGWGAQSLDFVTERGVPSDKFWPMKSRDRSNDNPATWENAKLHRVTQGWVDLQAAQYDRNLTFAQVATLLLCNVPCVGDFNWWGHSVCLLDLVDGSQQRHLTRNHSGKLFSLQEFDRVWGMDDEFTSGFSIRLLNSWSDSWSDRGMGVISGNKAIPNGSVAPRVTLPSPV